MALTVQLSAGWNLIGWPENAPSMTNEQLLERLEADGFQPIEIAHWFGGRYRVHIYKSQAEIWQMEAGVGYNLRVSNAGSWQFPGVPFQQQCPDGQTWDVALQVCKPAPVVQTLSALQPIVDWVQANPVLAVGIGLGGLLILSGGLKVKI